MADIVLAAEVVHKPAVRKRVRKSYSQPQGREASSFCLTEEFKTQRIANDSMLLQPNAPHEVSESWIGAQAIEGWINLQPGQ